MHQFMNAADGDRDTSPVRARIAMTALAVTVLALAAGMAWAAWVGMAGIREVTDHLTTWMRGAA